MNLKTLFTIALLLLGNILWSQTKTKKTEHPFWKNVHFGGGLQLNIGNGYTSFGISPSGIYDFSDKFSGGFGVSYLYSGSKYQNLHYHVFGMSAIALYNPIKYIQLSTEFEELSINRKEDDLIRSYWTPALYLGVAYSMNSNVAIGVRYDVLYDSKTSIYDNAFTPFFRVYF
jgi:long-subunit fatty acid transport protein